MNIIGYIIRSGLFLGVSLIAASGGQADELAPPFRATANGSPIDVEIGHAAPLITDLDGDGQWWAPSGRSFFSPGTNDSAAQELAFARQHFFLTHRQRDAFHTNATPTDNVGRRHHQSATENIGAPRDSCT